MLEVAMNGRGAVPAPVPPAWQVRDQHMGILIFAAAHFILLGLIDCFALSALVASRMWCVRACVRCKRAGMPPGMHACTAMQGSGRQPPRAHARGGGKGGSGPGAVEQPERCAAACSIGGRAVSPRCNVAVL